jgi:HAD superfamily hydrolase (TIGR01490 family)
MSKPFAVFDIDGTLIRWQLYHTIVLRLAKAGVLGENAREELGEAMMRWKRREDPEGFKSYEMALVERFEGRVQGVTTKLFDEIGEQVVEEYKDQVYTYTRDLIKSLKVDGYVLFAISGSPHEVVSRIAGHYGFDDSIGSIYERAGESFSGKYEIAAHNKEVALRKLMEKYAVSLEGSVAVGDSPSDIPMLSMVERSIAFNPDRVLFEAAKEKGWLIVVERKNVIYELESKNGHYQLAASNS